MRNIQNYNFFKLYETTQDNREVSLTTGNSIGYFITFIFYGNDGISNSALAVVGDSFESIALNILNDFALDQDDVNIESLSSIEDLMEAIDEHYEDSEENWNFFEYKYAEMTPRKGENSFKSLEGLLDIGEVIELGRNTFVDFDSKIFSMKG